MLLLLVLITLWICTWIGIGSFFFRRESLVIQFLIGFSITLFITEFLHFFIPLHPLHTLGFFLFGLYAFVSLEKSKDILSRIHEFLILRPILGVLTVTLLTFILFAASFPIEWYDSLLYHLPFAKLYVYNHVIPGIGLLHNRFGFISSTFSLTALSTLLPGTRQSLSLINTLYTVCLTCLTFYTIEKNKEISSFIFYFVLAAVGLAFSINGIGLVSSLAPELAVFFWLAIAVILTYEKKPGFAFLASVLGFYAKSSALPLVIFFGILMVRARSVQDRVPLLVSGALLTSYMILSALQTGYFLFPLEAAHFPLIQGTDVPVSEVKELRSVIYNWARHSPSKPVLNSNAAWFWDRFRPQVPNSVQLFFLATFMLMVLSAKRIKSAFPNALIPLAFSATCILGYMQAPDLRLLWPFLTLALASSFSVFASIQDRKLRTLPAILLLFLFFSSFALWIPRKTFLRKSQVLFPVETVYNQTAKKTAHELGFFYTVPIPGDDRCGMAQAPCIPDGSVISNFHYDVSDNKIQSVYRLQ